MTDTIEPMEVEDLDPLLSEEELELDIVEVDELEHDDVLDEPIPKKNTKPKDKTTYYVNKEVFTNAIIEFYKTDNVTDYLAESLVKISTGLSYAPNFINYTYRDEMVQDAVVKMYSALIRKKFDIHAVNAEGVKYNPFSYFTTIAFHAFVTRIKKEQKHRETIASYQNKIYRESLCGPMGYDVYVESGDDNE